MVGMFGLSRSGDHSGLDDLAFHRSISELLYTLGHLFGSLGRRMDTQPVPFPDDGDVQRRLQFGEGFVEGSAKPHHRAVVVEGDLGLHDPGSPNTGADPSAMQFPPLGAGPSGPTSLF